MFQRVITLAGCLLLPASAWCYTVTLEWDPSPSPTITFDTYRIYGCDSTPCNAANPSYTLDAEVGNTELVASVTKPGAGVRYFVNTSCRADGAGSCSNESGPSNEVCVDPTILAACGGPPPSLAPGQNLRAPSVIE